MRVWQSAGLAVLASLAIAGAIVAIGLAIFG